MPPLIKDKQERWNYFEEVKIGTPYGEISLGLGDPNQDEYQVYLYFAANEADDAKFSFEDNGYYISLGTTEELERLKDIVNDFEDLVTALEGEDYRKIIVACLSKLRGQGFEPFSNEEN